MDDLDSNKALITANAAEHKLPTLTHQEMHFVAALGGGISLRVAAARSGISYGTAKNLVEQEHIALHLEKLREEREAVLSETAKYTLEDAHLDIEHGKRMAANSMEWFKGVEMHMRLHGLGQEKKGPSVQVNIQNINNAKQLETLDDDALFELAGDNIARLQPENG